MVTTPGARLLASTSTGVLLGVLLATLAGGCGPAPTCASTCGDEIPRSRDVTLTLENGSTLPAYSSHPLDTPDPAITRAVIGIHGACRRADRTLDDLMEAVRMARQASSTLVVTPLFPMEQWADTQTGALCWKAGWVQGNDSTCSDPISSFEVLDQLVAQLGDRTRFPGLASIVIAGHSAGGQFTQRYAALGNGGLQGGPPVRYVVANPSSFMYLSELRPLDGSTDFQRPTPEQQLEAPGWNSYRYGLRDRPSPYLSRLDDPSVIRQFRSQEVDFLAGTADVQAGPCLDTESSALLQGPNRYLRSEQFYRYVQRYFPSGSQAFSPVPDARHSAREIFLSTPGLAALLR